MSQKIQIVPEKLFQMIQGSNMRLRSLDTEQHVSKPLLSCAKSSLASQGFFWEGSVGEPTREGIPLWKAFAESLFPRLSVLHSTRDTATGSSYTRLLEWDAQQGAWLGRVHAEWSHSHTPFPHPVLQHPWEGCLGRKEVEVWLCTAAQGTEMVAG